MKELEELKRTVDTLRELGDDWKENTAIIKHTMSEQVAVQESVKRLLKESNQSGLVKIGLTLIAFPFPIVIDDVLGWSLLAAGLIQKRVKNSALYLDDVEAFAPRLVEELGEIRQELARPLLSDCNALKPLITKPER